MRFPYTVDSVLRDVNPKGSRFCPPQDTKKTFWSYFCFILDFLMLAMTLARTCVELGQLLTTSMEITAIEHTAANGEEEHLAFRLTEEVTQKMNAIIDRKFTKLHATLEGIIKRIAGNTKHITEAGCRDVENYATSLSHKIAVRE